MQRRGRLNLLSPTMSRLNGITRDRFDLTVGVSFGIPTLVFLPRMLKPFSLIYSNCYQVREARGFFRSTVFYPSRFRLFLWSFSAIACCLSTTALSTFFQPEGRPISHSRTQYNLVSTNCRTKQIAHKASEATPCRIDRSLHRRGPGTL